MKETTPHNARDLMDGDAIRRALKRMAREIVESSGGVDGLAIVGICRGQSADARRYLEQACQLYEEHLRISELSTARVNLVELNHLTGNFKRALELVDQTLAQARSTHHPYSRG